METDSLETGKLDMAAFHKEQFSNTISYHPVINGSTLSKYKILHKVHRGYCITQNSATFKEFLNSVRILKIFSCFSGC